jgi:hypothetical protein
MDASAFRARLLVAVAAGLGAGGAAGCPAERPPGPLPVAPPLPIAPPVPPGPVPPDPVPAPSPAGHCDSGTGPTRRCFTPRTPPPGGGEMVVTEFHDYDANGCVPAAMLGHACNGMKAIAEPELTAEGCCYPICQGPIAPCGRPFVVAGHARVAPLAARSDWAQAIAAGEPDDGLAASWLRDAQLEHASVASFARFALELMRFGAPPELVAGAHRAALDEVRHAEVCFAIAARHGALDVGPGPLALGALELATSLAELVAATVAEGCVGETIGAALLAREAASAEDEVAPLLAGIAEDELRHAELAWRFVAWALGRAPELAGVIDRAFERALSAGVPAHARLDAEAWRATVAATLREVIAPCRRALRAA